MTKKSFCFCTFTENKSPIILIDPTYKERNASSALSKEKFKKSLDEILFKKSERPCTVCGIFRRYLLNLYAREYDVLVTGHNLDDEAQAVVMNLVKNNLLALQRAGPKTGVTTSKKFTERVKPLYFCLEKEVMVYAFINNLTTEFNECPNVNKAFRLRIRDMLNEIELKMPGTKKNIVNSKSKPFLEGMILQ